MNLGAVELLIIAFIVLLLIVPLLIVMLSGRSRGSAESATVADADRPLRPASQADMIAKSDSTLGSAERLDGTAAPMGGGLVGAVDPGGLAPSRGLAPDLDELDVAAAGEASTASFATPNSADTDLDDVDG